MTANVPDLGAGLPAPLELSMDDIFDDTVMKDLDAKQQMAALRRKVDDLLRDRAILEEVVLDMRAKNTARDAENATLKNQVALLLGERKDKMTRLEGARGPSGHHGPLPQPSKSKKSRLVIAPEAKKEESPPSTAPASIPPPRELRWKSDKDDKAVKEASSPSTAAEKQADPKKPRRENFPSLPSRSGKENMEVDSVKEAIDSVAAGHGDVDPQHMDDEQVTASLKRQRAASPTEGSSSSDAESPRSPQVAEESPGRIPPVVLRNKADFQAVRKYCLKNNIMVTCKDLRVGISIQVATIPAFRALTKYLLEGGVEHHTYRLKEDKNLKVVIRGIPVQFTAPDVAEELQHWGYQVTKVARLVSRRPDKKQLPMLVVELPRSEKRIYSETDLFNLKIKVEPLQKPTAPGQCFRCQQYGHAQSRCTAAPVCVRCGGPHRPGECTRSLKEPASCGLCGGPHPANYAGCPARPKPKQKTPQARPGPPSRRVTQGVSYASAATGAAKPQAGRSQAGAPPRPASTTAGAAGPLQALLTVLSTMDLQVLQHDLADFLRHKSLSRD